MGGQRIYSVGWILTRCGLDLLCGMYLELPPLFSPFLYQVCQMIDFAALPVTLLVVLDSGCGHTFSAGAELENVDGDIWDRLCGNRFVAQAR